MVLRRNIVLAGLVVLLLMLPVIGGCGQLDINLHTTVKTSGDIIQEIRFEASGMMAAMLEEADFTQDLEGEGWEFNIDRPGDSVILTATREFARDEAIIIPDLEGGGSTALGNVSLRTQDGLLSKEFFVELNIPGSGEMPETAEGGEMDEVTGAMLQGMFNISWTLTLPGQVVESNADIIQGGSATWNFDIDSMTEGRYLMVHSRYTNWPVIGGIIAGAVLVLALVVFFLIRRRRPPVSGSISPPTSPLA